MVVAPIYKDADSMAEREVTAHRSRPLRQLIRRWNSASLALQFLALGGLVSLVAMVLVGAVVTSLIEKAVTRNVAATTALYVDSVIARLCPTCEQARFLTMW